MPLVEFRVPALLNVSILSYNTTLRAIVGVWVRMPHYNNDCLH